MPRDINIEFFDEYKRLDKLCSEIYCENSGGVTSYIDDMSRVSSFESLQITEWNSTYYKLKALRYIRNQMAHGECSFEDDLCSNEDVQWLKNFRGKIMNISDPLAIYRKKIKDKSGIQCNKELITKSCSYENKYCNENNCQNKKIYLYLVLTIIFMIIFIVLILTFLK